MYEEDFVKKELVELDIKGRPGFKYMPVSAGEENDWLNKYIYIDDKGKQKTDYSKLNRLKLGNLMEVPYTKEIIKKIISIDKEWKDLTLDERWDLLDKLKPGLFNKIILAMDKVDNPQDNEKKNS